jgi:DNA-binding MarR family transcriptional regulator/ribosomal protein S18 acetylase RimI-like enzyme
MRTLDKHAHAVRQFNRFYTRCIGALGEAHLGTPFSLTEMRVLYELTQRRTTTATDIRDALGLDAGYLSRTLRAFRKRGYITAAPGDDRRRTVLSITPAGRKAFAPLEKRTRQAVHELLDPLSSGERHRVLDAMRVIRSAFGDPDVVAPRTRDNGGAHGAHSVRLRDPRPGDFGWVVQRHGAVYAEEFGYNAQFEALVARVVADFAAHWDPARERCWIAERNGAPVASIFVMAKSKTIAQLRLFLVEPEARGLGIGRRLVDEVIEFARGAGYRKVQLWTQSELIAARAIYKATGFTVIRRERHARFGKPLEAEIWERALD